jgi:hypothetical protein
VSKQDTYHIYFDSSISSVVMEWQGLTNSKQFREGSEEMLRLLRKHGVSRVLADLTLMKLISMNDREWVVKDFYHRALASGLRTIAFVRSIDYHNQLSIGTVVYELDTSQLGVEYFYDRQEAESWLSKNAETK